MIRPGTTTRFGAVVIAIAAATNQWRFFDCNKLPVLSVVGAVATVFLAYAVFEVVYRIATSDRPERERFAYGVAISLAGLGLVGVAGFFTMISHMCP